MFRTPASLVVTLASLLLVSLCTGSTSGWAAGNMWRTDFDAAYHEAVREQRPLLIHFYGQNCPPCRRMEAEVLPHPEIMGLLQSKFIAVKVDAGNPANIRGGELVQQFGVHGLPCDVIVDPLSGRLLSQVEGYQDLARYRTSALRSRSMFDQSHKIVVVERQTPKEPAQTEAPSQEPATETQNDVTLGTPQPLVGLDGFSPVSLGAQRAWTVGKPEFSFEYKGITYRMCSAEELDAFRTRPGDFAPRLLGCDPVVLSETDRAVPGRTDFGAFFDGDLYLFVSEESRRRFKTNPPKYTRIQHVLRVDHLPQIAKQPEGQGTVQ